MILLCLSDICMFDSAMLKQSSLFCVQIAAYSTLEFFLLKVNCANVTLEIAGLIGLVAALITEQHGRFI